MDLGCMVSGAEASMTGSKAGFSDSASVESDNGGSGAGSAGSASTAGASAVSSVSGKAINIQLNFQHWISLEISTV